MHIINDLRQWQDLRRNLSPTLSLGFVPTMGNLHRGHASLFQRSVEENDCTISSLFINPTQFNRPDDFKHYPRTLDADLALLEELDVDYCLLPDENAVYPDHYRFQIQENQLCQLMEGKHRPGHFNGVLTVVMKLLNLTKPHRAYFGEKDYQQYLLIKEMAAAFFMDLEIIACPTIREQSQLAYSSRNNRLSSEQRQRADRFAGLFHQTEKSLEEIQEDLRAEPIQIDYLETHFGRRFAAVLIDDIRLIDNYAL